MMAAWSMAARPSMLKRPRHGLSCGKRVGGGCFPPFSSNGQPDEAYGAEVQEPYQITSRADFHASYFGSALVGGLTMGILSGVDGAGFTILLSPEGGGLTI